MKKNPGKPRYGKKASRHAQESKMRTERSLKEAAKKSSPVKVYFDRSRILRARKR